ncbi:RICIN domain-containing protein [Amycolatopsis taiwanensis]|uniref:RICIN domain-containing protein n=1 Tax=Amycolatopsis taiwanensis TaxID=342230 RepID=UPI00047FD2BB|nr:RICIN domain-containing protein [Amycolatopsis taiwanensis]
MFDDWPDPATANDPAEFVAAMRRLRAHTDLSYRELTRRAARTGGVLPSSTISGALSRDALPRADLLATFIRACGGDEATVQRWLAARSRLAAGAIPDDTEPYDDAEPKPAMPSAESEPSAKPEPVTPSAEPEPVTPARRKRLGWPALGVATLAVAVIGVLLTTSALRKSSGDQSRSTVDAPPRAVDAATSVTNAGTSPAAAPPTGPVRLRLAHTGLCTGEGPEKFVDSGRTVLGQYDCATASPPMTLEPDDGAYRLVLHHPTNGEGCVTVDYGGTHTEVLLAGAECEKGRKDQRFLFEPVAEPRPGYRLHSASGPQWCIGVFQDSADAGVQLIQNPCNGNAAQEFTVEPGAVSERH